jgi:guanylate kinase
LNKENETEQTTDSPAMGRRGLMLVLSSPSGAGKTTISRALLDRDPDISLSISATTRPARPGEIDGRDYLFVGDDEFKRMIEDNKFLEHADVFDHRYGTPREPVEQALCNGRDVLFDVDWQGAQQLRHAARDDVVGVFVLPPSHDELERRLHTRAQDSDEVVRRRMDKAASEMSHWSDYDYIVVNRDVGESVSAVEAILAAERLRRERQLDLPDFVARLCGGE